MADNQRLICASADLQEKAQGIKFGLPELGERTTGFVVRYNGVVYGFVNQCAHIPVELDWNEGDFFDLSRNYLICSTHGAHYQPQTGYCVMGPCKGRRLKQLKVSEQDEQVFVELSALE